MKITILGELRVKVRLGNWWPLSTLTKTHRLPINEVINSKDSVDYVSNIPGSIVRVKAGLAGEGKARVVITINGFQVWSQDIAFNDQIKIKREITKGVFLDVVLKVE